MKRFLIHVSTYWCGMDATFRAVAESEMDLWDLAEQLAYDNFQSYGCESDIAEEEGYDPEYLKTVIEIVNSCRGVSEQKVVHNMAIIL